MKELVVIIRPSFMKFCKDGCRAALFNHILYWIARKVKDQPQEAVLSGEITYYATTEELIECLAGAWGREKVRMETNNLVKMGLVGRGKNPKFGADRTKHFHFGEEQCEKLFELCQKHEICLACLDLDDNIEHLIKTVKQNPNLGNAKPESMICFSCVEHEHYPNLGFAKPESGQAITKITTKTVKPKNSERKNDAPEQNSTVSTQDDSHSSTHASFISSSQEKVVLTEDEQRIIEFAKKDIFKAKLPEVTEKLKNECAELVLHIETQEQFNSLLDHVKAKLKPPYHLKNMVNALNDWLQTQTPVTEPLLELPSDPVVTDEELADDVWKLVQAYQDEERFEEHLNNILSFKRKAELSNYTMCDKIANMYRIVPSNKYGIDDFFEQFQ